MDSARTASRKARRPKTMGGVAFAFASLSVLVACSSTATTATSDGGSDGGNIGASAVISPAPQVQADTPATLPTATLPTATLPTATTPDQTTPDQTTPDQTTPDQTTSPSTLPLSPSDSPVPSALSNSTTTVATTVAPTVASARSPALKLVAAARRQIGETTGYDPAYVDIPFPNGDVPRSSGVCSDVVVRALRDLGIDLQERINTDMRANFNAYPKKWGLAGPDSNIDHRRVGNIERYFERREYALPNSTNASDYKAGDIVSFDVPQDHIGIVSDRKKDGHPLVIHNIGGGVQEEDVLFAWTIVGHYRVLRG